MTAFEQIRKSLEMTALVRSAVTGNEEEVSLKDGLTKEEYAPFKKMYINEPYGTIRQMNDFMGRMRHDYDVMERHVDACLELECLVEEENLLDNIAGNEEIKSGIPEFINQGYRALWNDNQDTGRVNEKVAVDKRSIRSTLKIAKLFATGNRDDDCKTLEEIARYLQEILKYDMDFVKDVARGNPDNSVMISLYKIAGRAVCRQHELFMQLAAQEAGIPAKMKIGEIKGSSVWHMWGKAKPNGKTALLDVTNLHSPVIIGERLIQCYEKASKLTIEGRPLEYIEFNPRVNYYKYSTRGLRCGQ